MQSKAIEPEQPALDRELSEVSSHETRMWPTRESWELLVPSLAVAFTSRGSAQWRPEALPDDVRAEILSGLRRERRFDVVSRSSIPR